MAVINSLEKSVVREIRSTPVAKSIAKSAPRAMEQDALKLAAIAAKSPEKHAAYEPAAITKAVGRLMVATGNKVAELSFRIATPVLGETGGQLISMAAAGPVYIAGTGITLAVAGGAELWKKIAHLVR